MNATYLANLSKSYGIVASGNKGNMQKYQGNISIDDINIGDKFYSLATKKFSTVTDKTSSSIELLNLKMSKKGIDSKNWYDMLSFNRLYISRIDGEISKQLNILW